MKIYANALEEINKNRFGVYTEADPAYYGDLAGHLHDETLLINTYPTISDGYFVPEYRYLCLPALQDGEPLDNNELKNYIELNQVVEYDKSRHSIQFMFMDRETAEMLDIDMGWYVDFVAWYPDDAFHEAYDRANYLVYPFIFDVKNQTTVIVN